MIVPHGDVGVEVMSCVEPLLQLRGMQELTVFPRFREGADREAVRRAIEEECRRRFPPGGTHGLGITFAGPSWRGGFIFRVRRHGAQKVRHHAPSAS
ncbi:unnamed protein product [Vitrella brassicaformis CCMP3155]|uniref:Uncharacterized protein n=1 Tax=Vitrella brassicaformis (strain CCMP3155) TaxID=1169540 RepID=A0A0G4G955_VITBC|nr:unnamed protein product [Vitrella brassicaformis CCMP3155]|mmetsp:Transcript_44452/g.125729  ORF Transcript_44452/g.125729 Transcript_44452/m.125729 type:complete len:97 (-) Transcript_44452:2670-2960(-)|eukprot:CEM25410.1 unnamed protein product [Vitrella brassicaformis CCMP3155]